MMPAHPSHPTIFLSNDDGIHSPGLRAAVEAVLPLGHIVVVAPSAQQTGAGRSLMGNMEARLIPLDYEIHGRVIAAYHCECSPALAVHHGLNVLCAQQPPALVISGINYGENVGTTITTSGTVGAAYEGASRGVPALAISVQTDEGAYFEYDEKDWGAAVHFLAYFARILLKRQLPADVDVLKIDVPATATAETPWRITRLSRQPYYATSLVNPSLESRIKDAELKIRLHHAALEPDSDIYALRVDQVVSVTPLSLDLTSRADFQQIADALRKNDEEIFEGSRRDAESLRRR